MIRIPAKLENSKGIGSSSNVEHQLDNERKPQYQQEQQYKSPPHSGLESEATDFSSHILSPVQSFTLFYVVFYIYLDNKTKICCCYRKSLILMPH